MKCIKDITWSVRIICFVAIVRVSATGTTWAITTTYSTDLFYIHVNILNIFFTDGTEACDSNALSV